MPPTGGRVQETKSFAIVRTQKIKNLAELAGRSRHNSRTAEKGTEHASSPGPRFGGGIHLLAGENDTVAMWHEKLAERSIDPKRLRKDSVKAVEMVLTASGDWFNNATDKERWEWARRSLSFAAEKFGADNILSAHLHDDEETPHLHILAAPLVFKERAQRGRARKGREGSKRKAQPPAWGLSAKDFIGGSKHQHEKLQTAYWEAVADLGLRRGVPAKLTGARNMSPAMYRARQEAKLTEIERHESQVIGNVVAAQRLRASAERDRQEAARTLAAADDTAAALSLGLDAIVCGELTHRPRTPEKPTEGLRLKNTAQPIIPRGDGLSGWTAAVRPYWSALVGFAKRIASVREREQRAVKLSQKLDEERDAHLRTASRQARHERQSGNKFGEAQKDTQIIAKARSRGQRQR